MDATFRVKTEADLSGLRQLSNLLDDIGRKSKNITTIWQSSGFPGGVGSSSGGTIAPANTGTPQRRARAAGGMRYDLSTPSGLQQWSQNVLEPEAGFLTQMFRGFGLGVGIKPHPSPLSTIAGPSARPLSGGALNDWFAGLSSQSASMPASMRTEYYRAAANYALDSNAIPSFYQQYGSHFGAGTPTGSGGGGGSGTSVGAFLGSMAKQSLPFVSAVTAGDYAKNQIAGGYNLWQQSSSPIDQLSHSLGTAAQNVETFRQQITSAGAAFGLSVQQSTQAALSFAQVFGNIGQGNISNMVATTGAWSQQNGVPYTQTVQMNNTAGLLGITSGVGASMNSGQFLNMVSNMTSMGGVNGRQGEMGTAYLTLGNQIGNMNPVISNPQVMAGTLAALSKTGLQAFQGMRGEQVASTLYGGFMNAGQNPVTQGTLYAAMYRATNGKVNNPLQMLYLAQSGPQTKLSGTNITVGDAYLKYIRSQTSNPYMQENMLVSAGMATSMPNAAQILKTPGLFDTTVSTTNNTPFWLSLYDRVQNTMAQYGAGQSNFGTAVAPLQIATHSLGSAFNTAATLFGGGLVLKYGAGGAMRVLGQGLSTLAGRGGSGFTTMGGPSVLSRIGSGAGSLWSRFGGVIKGAGLDALGGAEEVGGTLADATGVGSIAGIPLNILGAATMAAGTGMIAKGIYNQATSSHASIATSHANQVQQKAQQRSDKNWGTVTIDSLRINQIVSPSGSSILGSALNAGNAYAPTNSFISTTGTAAAKMPTWLQSVENNFSSATGGGSGWIPPKTTSQFVSRMLPYAQQVSKGTGIPAKDLIAQWGLESNGGKSEAATANLNFAGINAFGKYGPGKDNAYAGFSSLSQFAQADIQVLMQKQYAGARQLAQSGASASAVFAKLTQEGYDTTQANVYGNSVQSWVNSVSNVSLDQASATAIGHAVASAIGARGYGGAIAP